VAHGIDVLLPMTEVTTLTLLGDPALRDAHVATPFASAETVSQAADKAFVLRLAQSLGVPIPATVEVPDPDSLDVDELPFGYPVVAKPARSRVRTADGWISGGTSYATDADSLRNRLASLPRELFPVLVQERVEGDGAGVFMCYADGRRVATFAHRRLREMPPSGGVSVLCESCDADPVAVAHASRLLTTLDWCGPAMVEFKRDLRDGSLRLMEINGRFWGSLQLAIDAGVDFPAMAVDIAAGMAVTSVDRYRVGARSRWFWGDASATMLLLTRGARALSLPADHPGRWRTLWQFLRTGGEDTHNEVWRADDWRPYALETAKWFVGK
jgi:predicted ATP-grasp superfamily ATP-dependent carboligase